MNQVPVPSLSYPSPSWQLFLKSICVLHALIHPEPRHSQCWDQYILPAQRYRIRSFAEQNTAVKLSLLGK